MLKLTPPPPPLVWRVGINLGIVTDRILAFRSRTPLCQWVKSVNRSSGFAMWSFLGQALICSSQKCELKLSGNSSFTWVNFGDLWLRTCYSVTSFFLFNSLVRSCSWRLACACQVHVVLVMYIKSCKVSYKNPISISSKNLIIIRITKNHSRLD